MYLCFNGNMGLWVKTWWKNAVAIQADLKCKLEKNIRVTI